MKKLTVEQLLYDCYNQWAYESKKGLWNGGLSVLEDIEALLGFESPIMREDLWALRDVNTEEVPCIKCGYTLDECICNIDFEELKPQHPCPECGGEIKLWLRVDRCSDCGWEE